MVYIIDNIEINILVKVNRRLKNIRIKVSPPNTVTFNSPSPLAKDYIISTIEKHRRFILNHISTPINHENDYSIHLFGKKYELVILESPTPKYTILADSIIIYSPSTNDMTISQVVMLLYRMELEKIVENNIEKIKNDMNINFPICIEYKNVKTFYGECIPKRKKLIFSLKLAKYDPIFIYYVIYHELTHFYYSNHQDDFYNLLESKFPNCKKIQHELRKIKYNDRY